MLFQKGAQKYRWNYFLNEMYFPFIVIAKFTCHLSPKGRLCFLDVHLLLHGNETVKVVKKIYLS